MTSTTASATSDITSPRRTQVRAPTPSSAGPTSFSEMLTTCSRRCSSGARPKSTPVTIEMASVNSEHDRVERDLGRSRQALRIRRQQRAQAGEAERGAERAAGERQHDPFGQELPQQPPASGAERRADRELPLPRLGARQQQVGEIGAGDEQHEPDRALQHPQRRADAADEVVLQPVEPQPMSLRVGRVRRRSAAATCASIDSRSARACASVTPSLSRPTRYRKWPPRPPGFAGSIVSGSQTCTRSVVDVVARRHDADDARRCAVDRD